MRQLPVIPPSPEGSPADLYGHARVPEHGTPVQYGRFRNVYLYITNKCQLHCAHCYMGDRLDSAETMPTALVRHNLRLWRSMGGSKLSLLGGEPTLHPDFELLVKEAHSLGYEKVILNTHGLPAARARVLRLSPAAFSYVQVSIDGGSAASHECSRGAGTFQHSTATVRHFADHGLDTRIICTVTAANIDDCLQLIEFAESSGATLLKYHVMSGIGVGRENDDLLVAPPRWVEFCDALNKAQADNRRVQIWYQPTYVRRSDIPRYFDEGYRGCIGRTLDRISVFPDGRAYVCSYLFDTTLNFATVTGDGLELNRGDNEYEHFVRALVHSSCGDCKNPVSCQGGCPAEALVMGGASCKTHSDIVPVCRLWKSDV